MAPTSHTGISAPVAGTLSYIASFLQPHPITLLLQRASKDSSNFRITPRDLKPVSKQDTIILAVALLIVAIVACLAFFLVNLRQGRVVRQLERELKEKSLGEIHLEKGSLSPNYERESEGYRRYVETVREGVKKGRGKGLGSSGRIPVKSSTLESLEMPMPAYRMPVLRMPLPGSMFG